ncbi:MAG: TlpA family protein disulfide reductase [Bdellovibrionales bacterium]|nr:TlpA family protein disulfide reductase [Bdellovibrionales bacterium]
MIYRILVIILIVAATIGYSVYQKNSLKSQLVSESKSEAVLNKLPTAEFSTLEGEPFNVDELYTKERVDLLVVHYWGTWCAPCEAELPDLLQLIKRFEGQPNVKFLLVAANDEVIKIKKHLKTLAIPNKASLYWLLDNKNVHREAFGTTRVPETFVFSSDKTTLRKFTGPQEWNKTLFFQTFDELVQISTRKL